MGTPEGALSIYYIATWSLWVRTSLQPMLCFGQDSECCDWGFGGLQLGVEGSGTPCTWQSSNPMFSPKDVVSGCCIKSWHHVV